MKPQYTEIERMGSSSQGRNGRRVTNFLLHTQEGDGTAESLAGYLNNPNNGASYHYTVRNGIVVDVVDTDLASWSVGDANSYTINLCFAGSRASWSRAEWLNIRDDIRIAAWLAVQDAAKYGFSTEVIAPPYGRARPGISDHRYITDVIGWGSHTDVGSGFPWDVFAADVAEFTGSPSIGADMQLSDTITDAYGNKVSVGDILKWVAYHTDITADQLGGRDTRRDIPAKFNGWPQLGDRTVVNALAAIGEKLGIDGFGGAK
ncbi:N-acetylmuramoyl-L-alanine amidase [Nocardia australiensis]|uniref:N-acetylmuramoyl-L-alanine amidase n=1 Tax=Nocardia australiensis TaxID=2887191 RepID=UPI001D1404B7|nr:N-acetylmuramoyl-L-alanine amidase [Nocardia australiensis]